MVKKVKSVSSKRRHFDKISYYYLFCHILATLVFIMCQLANCVQKHFFIPIINRINC